jgi:hypothetical protein
MIFNIFSLYGVIDFILVFNKSNCALIQFADK